MIIEKNNIKMQDWLDEWMKTYKIADLCDSTYDSYQGYINSTINPRIGCIKVQELVSQDIQEFYAHMQKPKEHGGLGLSGATIRKIKNIISGALKQAIANRIIKENPLDGTIPPKIKDVDIRILSSEEQELFSSVLDFYNTGNMFAFNLACGARIGELCALEESDINRIEKYIDITKTASRVKDKYTGSVGIKVRPPKTRHSRRRIPLLPSMEVILDRQKILVDKMKSCAGGLWIENSLIFPTDTGRIHDLSGLRSSVKRIAKRVGIENITLHALRHTYITSALNSGVAAQNVARLVGHKDGATTLKYYAHYINTEAISQLENLEDKNIIHYSITAGELEQIKKKDKLVSNSVSEKIKETIERLKYRPQVYTIKAVLKTCEEILLQPIDHLSAEEKGYLLNILAQYTKLKNQFASDKIDEYIDDHKAS